MRGKPGLRLLDRLAGVPLVWLLGLSARLFPARGPAGPPRRILVFKLAAIGDAVVIVPLLRALRRAYPQAHIAFVASGLNAEVLRACPYVDRVFRLDLKDVFARPWRLLHFVRGLRAYAPDVAIDAEQWLRLTALLAWAAGAPRRVGFRTGGHARHHLFTDVVEHRPGRHEVEAFLDLGKALGIEATDRHLELFLDEPARQEAEAVLARLGLAGRRPLVLFHSGCGGNEPRRQWAPERFAELGDRLAARYGAAIAVTGDPGERPLAEAVAARMREPAAIAAGETSIMGLAALIARADLVVCGNTGAMHLAAAAGVPVVAMHGPNDPAQWGPWSDRAAVVSLGLSCSPCLYLGHEFGCKPAPCMGDMTVDQVWAATQQLLSDWKAGTPLSV